MLDFLLGRGIDVYHVVIILEFILAIYSVSLSLCTERKVLKIAHMLFALLWVVLALMNLFT